MSNYALERSVTALSERAAGAGKIVAPAARAPRGGGYVWAPGAPPAAPRAARSTRTLEVMGKLLLVLLVAAAIFVAFRFVMARSSATTDGGAVTLKQFPALVERIATTGKNGAFWVVLIPDTARADGFAANFQISMESGRLGMDWVLLAQRNVEDRSKFEDFVRSQGFQAKELVGNDVHYLRVEDGDRLADMSSALLRSMYGVSDTTKMQLIITDFTWP
jgi:hypothetical protein